MTINKFEDLECWQETRKLTRMVYSLVDASSFRDRGFRLTDQITGAALSVMNNIVEGFDSQSNPEFIKFLGYARRSASEVQTCLYAALDTRSVTQSHFDTVYQQAEKTRKVVDGFRRYLRGYQRDHNPAGLRVQSGQRANGPTGQRA